MTLCATYMCFALPYAEPVTGPSRYLGICAFNLPDRNPAGINNNSCRPSNYSAKTPPVLLISIHTDKTRVALGPEAAPPMAASHFPWMFTSAPLIYTHSTDWWVELKVEGDLAAATTPVSLRIPSTLRVMIHNHMSPWRGKKDGPLSCSVFTGKLEMKARLGVRISHNLRHPPLLLDSRLGEDVASVR